MASLITNNDEADDDVGGIPLLDQLAKHKEMSSYYSAHYSAKSLSPEVIRMETGLPTKGVFDIVVGYVSRFKGEINYYAGWKKASVSCESSATNLWLPSTNASGISNKEQCNVTLEINNAASISCMYKRVTYKEEDKCKIAKYANHCGTTNVVRFKKEFPKLTESTIRGWLTKYRSQLKNTPQTTPQDVQIGTKRGRPLLLPDELDFKLRSFIINLRTAGGTIALFDCLLKPKRPIFRHRCHIKRQCRPSIYYANSVSTFQPLLVGDLVFKINPGPMYNAGLMGNKTADVLDYVCDCKADLFAFTETWLKDDDDAERAEICPNGYTFIGHNRIGRLGDDDHPVTVTTFCAEFARYMESALLTKERLVIVGDLNIYVDDKVNSEALSFLDVLESLGLQHHVNDPTHIHGHTLDLIITRIADNIIMEKPHVDRFFSDHASVLCKLLSSKPRLMQKRITYRKIKLVDLSTLVNELAESSLCRNISHNSNVDILSASDLDNLAETYNTTLSHLLDSHAPLKTKTVVSRLKVAWNPVTYLLNKAKHQYYTESVDENSSDQGRLFRASKKLLGYNDTPLFAHYEDKSLLQNGPYNLRSSNKGLTLQAPNAITKKTLENVTMAETNSKHVAKKGGSDKRGMTLTLAETLDGSVLPFQLIYQGKTARYLPATNFPEEFCLSCNKKHWSNGKETLRLINDVLHPYIQRTKARLGLDENARTVLIWDSFKAQSSKLFEERVKELNIISEMVAKNMTHLLQPLDLSTNEAVKNMEKRALSEYFTSCITDKMLRNPGKDVTTIEIDLKLSTLKPRHGKLMKEVYEWLLTDKGKRIILSGWRSAGIMDCVKNARNGQIPSSNLPLEFCVLLC
ncbi:hypothetical protein AWC38_SpisGene17650 [Stylophora pistillata]|uniref:DDE-1 domain-containing protein n=1 Tax=Stylophora pistillata TaxID=50429 RepID=A0A2B4RLH2_STYPI|nr:hypothetical protein AWC38_SpisGene17650 [Stylophora pistillata]